MENDKMVGRILEIKIIWIAENICSQEVVCDRKEREDRGTNEVQKRDIIWNEYHFHLEFSTACSIFTAFIVIIYICKFSIIFKPVCVAGFHFTQTIPKYNFFVIL